MDHYVITIARGYGSGGKTIGKMLSEKLDIPFYDSEWHLMTAGYMNAFSGRRMNG